MARRNGSDQFGWRGDKPQHTNFDFKNFKGTSSANQLARPMPWKQKFRPDFNLKDFSILFDYNYASMWTRWRRGYELYMYANQNYEGINYTFQYFNSGQAGIGTSWPGVLYMFPSTDADKAMRTVAFRPRDSFNFLDYNLFIDGLKPLDNNVYACTFRQTFGAPISYFTGEVLCERFGPGGSPIANYNCYSVIGVGIDANPVPASSEQIFNTIFIKLDADNSYSIVDNERIAVPAIAPPTPGNFFSTEMRFGCNCPDFLAREDFNLYKYNQHRRYPYTLPQDLKPGIYDTGREGDQRFVQTRDNPGYTRDFGFIYLNRIIDLPRYNDDAASSYSDPGVLFYAPRWCKHIYASLWDIQNRFFGDQDNYIRAWLQQPTDEPMDNRYREEFDRNLERNTDFYNRQDRLNWWQRYGPSLSNISTQISYEDVFPMMVKTLNFDVSASGDPTPLVSSGYAFFTIDQYNPFAPSALNILDGGLYSNGVLVSGSDLTYAGFQYSSGVAVVPSGYSTWNGGVY